MLQTNTDYLRVNLGIQFPFWDVIYVSVNFLTHWEQCLIERQIKQTKQYKTDYKLITADYKACVNIQSSIDVLELLGLDKHKRAFDTCWLLLD